MKTIIYIHGFNSGPGTKVNNITKLGYNVVSPQLTNNPLTDINNLISIIDKLLMEDQSQIEVIGTSLGGFYALILRRWYNSTKINFHCINPSFNPQITLKKYLNKTLTNYKTNKKYVLSSDFCTNLAILRQELNNLKINDFNYINFYFGTNDEVLVFDDILSWINSYTETPNINYSEQDHRFSNLTPVLNNLKWN